MLSQIRLSIRLL